VGVFSYDRLNRLLQSSGTGFTTHSQSFNAVGNITYKSDVGTYNYNAQGTPCTSGTGGGGPHALCSITGTVNGYTNPGFTYDANGNLTAGLGRTLTYTSFNMPATITAPNNLVPTTSVTYTWVYNADHERTKHIIDRTDGTFTTIYLHPAGKGQLLYEKEIKPSITEHKHYIVAGSMLIGVYLSRSDSTTETRYMHSDRLGSLTLITNSSGGVLERLAYEPYGKRRYPAGTDDTANGLYGITTDRGFTGHEGLDEIALVHMNGRIYDPLLGRFFTSDPNVPGAGDLQAYNRYSYVYNNPLGYVDPTGYWPGFLEKLGITPRTVVAIAVAAFVGPQGYFGVAGITGDAFASALVAGFASGAINSGSLQGGLQGAFTASLFYGVGGLPGGPGGIEKVLGHAAAGCISSAASGGQCGSGALSAGFAEFAGPKVMTDSFAANVAIRAVLGGTAAVAGGGNFGNGAVTAAFGYLFNHCSHGACTTSFEQAMYDYWPGYKAGTLLYNQTIGDGSWTGWELLDAASVGIGATGAGVKAAFNGGANSVFWSGYSQGARNAAEALGVTLEKTVGGRFLEWTSRTVGIKVPDSVWNFASSTFANNAQGTASAVIRAEGRVWSTIEKPILQQRGIPINYR
jgi:RHS repeat-associated protein